MHPATITLTGADARTSLADVAALLAYEPRLEIGLLLSLTPEGRNRYPSRDWLAQAAKTLSGRCAIHVCGTAARRALQEGQLADLLDHAPRVQVNGQLTAAEVEVLAALYPRHTLITQLNRNNVTHLVVRAPNHALLVDGSGGRGIAPDHWPKIDSSKPVGFAGGLGPDNIQSELDNIQRAATGPFWIDMESSLRNGQDWFDLALAGDVLAKFAVWTRAQQPINDALRTPLGQTLEAQLQQQLGRL